MAPRIDGITKLIIHRLNVAATIPSTLELNTDHKNIAISPRAKTDKAGGNGKLDCKKNRVLTPKIAGTNWSVTPKKNINSTYCPRYTAYLTKDNVRI